MQRANEKLIAVVGAAGQQGDAVVRARTAGETNMGRRRANCEQA
jgi:hypothetical protein